MKNDPCRSPSCQWLDRCPLRPSTEPSAGPAAAIETPTPYQGNGDGVTFALRLDMPPPVIGELRVTGFLSDEAVNDALNELEIERPSMGGLLLVLNTQGGRATAGQLLELAVLEAKAQVPVVAYIQRAYSAGLLPAWAADQTFIATDGDMGGFGSILPACDGSRPFVLCSKQSPQKHDGSPMQPLFFIRRDDVGPFQNMLDGDFDRSLRWAATCTGREPADLAEFLDGRLLDARQALAAGLVAGVLGHEGIAVDLLINLARTGRKTLF